MAECLMCGANAVNTRQDYSSRTIYNCGNCGMYVVSDMSLGKVKKHSCKIAGFLRHRQITGKHDTILIAFEKAKLDKGYLQLTVDQILDILPKNFSEQIDGSLQNLALLSAYPGDEVKLESLDKAPLFYTNALNFDALSFIIKAMTNNGLIEVNYYSGAFLPCGIIVSPKGWERVEQINTADNGEKTLSVLYISQGTNFSEESLAAARGAVEECGLSLAISDALSEGRIGNELISELRHRDMVICDLTEAKEELYYAIGFAQALGKPLALSCNEKDFNNIRLNLSHNCVIAWDDEKELQLQLYHYIRARML